MFLVSDTLQSRQDKVRSFLVHEPAIAVLLAAADFEWTVRRAILALGYRPNSIIRRESLHRCSGIDGYTEAWMKEVVPYRRKRLPAIIPNWRFFKEQAYGLRHKLIHGINTSPGASYAEIRCDSILKASASLVVFANKRNVDLYGRLPVRRKERSLK